MIPTPYKIAAGVAAIVLVLIAAFWYVSHERAQAYADGQRAERVLWQAREAEELAKANAALVAAQKHASELEAQAAEDLAALDAEHLKKEKALEASHDRFLDDLRAGRVRLFTAATACAGAHSGAPGAPAAAPGVGDAAAPGDVPGALRAAVAGGDALAHEADQVALALAGAQAYIATALRTCNTP